MYVIIRFQIFPETHGLCNPQICSVHASLTEAQTELDRLNECDPSVYADIVYKICNVFDENGDTFRFRFYTPPEIRWYTAKEICEMFNISRARLSQLTDGRIQAQSKKEYSEMPAIPLDAVKLHLTGKRAKVMYNEKAIKVLKKYFTKQLS